MLYTPPTIQPTNVTSQNIQQLPVESVPGLLQRSDSSSFIKKLVLGYLVNKSIKDNEAQSILTGVEIMDLTSKKTLVSHNSNTQHFAASVNKVPVALLVLEDIRAGKITLNQKVAWEASDMRAGAGVYDQPGAPLQATVGEVIFDMLNPSGNTAVRILVNKVLGGAAAVNQRWAAIPELANTRLQPLDANRFYVGNSTPHDAMWAMQKVVSKNDASGKLVKNALKTNIYTNVSVRSQLAGNDYIVLVNKVGLLDDVEGNNRHDVGIIYNTRTHASYGFSLFTTSPYESETATPQAEQSLKDIGRYTLRYSGDKKQHEATQLRALDAAPREKRILY